jgi:anti-sigma regulatory factor (Ser/Thr protein kinase)
VYGSTSYPAVLASVPQARSWLTDQLGATTSDRLLHDAQLCLSELAANAVRHAHTPFTVEVSDVDGPLYIGVRDHDNAMPELRDPGAGAVGGQGLRIVAALATQWGIEPHHPDGKTIWCELELVGRDRAALAPIVPTTAS